MSFFRINNKTIHAPSEITLSYEVLDKSERTMDGTMVVDIIGRKEKVDIKWNYLSGTDLEIITKEINNSTFVTIEYCSPEQENLKTMVSRAEGVTYSPFFDWTKGKIIWQSVSISFVER